MLNKKHAAVSGRLVIVGFGSIGRGVLPLLLRHLEIEPGQITIITAEPRGHEVAAEYGVRFIETALTRENYRATARSAARPRRFSPQRLGRRVERRTDRAVPGERARSISTPASSRGRAATPIRVCRPQRARTTRCGRVRSALRPRYPGGPTAVITHGANPGLVSHFVKQALIDLARDIGSRRRQLPRTRDGWALLARAARSSRSSISPSATPRSRRSPKSRASSSTPGRSTGSSAKARSPPSSAGGRMNGTFRRMGGATISAAVRRSICCARVRRPASAAGRRSKALSRVSDHPRRDRSRSPII